MPKRRKALAVVSVLGVLAFSCLLTLSANRSASVVQAAPAGQNQPPVRVVWDWPDFPGWVVVEDYLVWSGCPPEDWLCWSEWIAYENEDPSYVLLEKKDGVFGRLRLGNGVPNPPNFPPFGYIFDERARCTDGDLAKGVWHHNAHAKALFYPRPIPDTGQYEMYCEWRLDPESKHSWSFAEDDDCWLACEDTPPPWPTVCFPEPPPPPPAPPPSPTPFAPVGPDVSAQAFVHSRLDPEDDVYKYGPEFYWPWGHFLNASLTAKVIEPQVDGCFTSSRVTAYWFKGSVGETVCPWNSSDPNCRWRKPYEGGAHPDVATKDWIHLLWAWSETPVTQDGTWTFANIGPVWVDVEYTVMVLTTYYCGENTYTHYWPEDLTLLVGLVRTVRTP